MDNVEGNPTQLDFIPEINFDDFQQEPTEGGDNQDIQKTEDSSPQGDLEGISQEKEKETGEEIQARTITPQDVPDLEEDPKDQADGKTGEYEFSPDENPTAVGIYKTMVQEGIISESDDFKGTFDEIRDYISNMPQRVAQALYSQAPDHGKALLDYVFTKGADLSPTDLKQFINTYLEDVNSATEPNLTNPTEAESYLRNSLKGKGISDRVINATVDALIDKDPDGSLLLEEARKDWESGKASREEKHRKIIEQEKAEIAAREQQMKDFAISVYAELDNTGWKSNKISEVKSALRNNIIENSLRDIMQNPKAYGQLAAILTVYDSNSKTFNLKDFALQAVSGDAKETRRNIIEDNFSSLGANSKQVDIEKKKDGSTFWDSLEVVI